MLFVRPADLKTRKACPERSRRNALAIALDRAFGDGKPEGLSLIHDRGSQFTAWSFKEMVERMKINDVVTAVRHPQSCGRLERFHRTFKEECIWLAEWESLGGLEVAVSQYVDHYNFERIHSALGYLTPMEVHRLAIGDKASLQIAA
ncbi:MAG TPA: integrase core domain-containing protein [Acidobacteriota bacterium]|nr:integrase core domain-containing protein [Acidobacteriota bacterium]